MKIRTWKRVYVVVSAHGRIYPEVFRYERSAKKRMNELQQASVESMRGWGVVELYSHTSCSGLDHMRLTDCLLPTIIKKEYMV